MKIVLRKGHLLCSKKSSITVEPYLITVSVSYSVPSLTMGFEHGHMSMWSQHCASALPNPQLEFLSTVPAFFSVTGFSMGFEQVDMFE